MRQPIQLGLALALAAGPASAGSLELAAYLGPALPFYEQTFRYDPGITGIRIPGVTIRQQGVLDMEGRGGLAAGAAATWYFLGILGIEGRIDTADVSARVTGARFEVTLEPPAPAPSLSTPVDVGSGSVRADRLRSFSLNLKLKAPAPLRLTASAGISYLPDLDFTVTQTVGLGVSGFNSRLFRAEIASLALRAEAVPTEEDEGGKLGANLGVGFQVSILPRLAVLVEGRYFVFEERRLRWSAAGQPRNPVEEALLVAVLNRLPAVEFDPTFFQLAAGVSLTF